MPGEKGNLAAISYDGVEVVNLRDKTLAEGAKEFSNWVKAHEDQLERDFQENCQSGNR